MKRERIFDLIGIERSRQDQLHPSPRNLFEVLAPSILGEECGEVHKAWLENNNENLKEKLIHVAAVAVRWLELFDD